MTSQISKDQTWNTRVSVSTTNRCKYIEEQDHSAPYIATPHIPTAWNYFSHPFCKFFLRKSVHSRNFVHTTGITLRAGGSAVHYWGKFTLIYLTIFERKPSMVNSFTSRLYMYYSQVHENQTQIQHINWSIGSTRSIFIVELSQQVKDHRIKRPG